MKNILVPLDLTRSTEPELSGAIQVVKACKGSLFLVEFLPTHAAGFREHETTVFDAGYSNQEILNVEVVKNHTHRMERYATIYRSEGIPVTGEVISDTFSHGVNQYVESNNIDLIIMEATGKHNLLQKLKGNRVERAIEGNNCPVLSLQKDLDVNMLRKMVLAVDFDIDYEPGTLNILQRLGTCLEADISLVYIKPEEVDPVELNNKVFHFRNTHGFKGSPVHFVQAEDVEGTLVRFAENTGAGLIAVISQAEGGILRMFTNSVSESVANRADIPVLTIKD